MTDQRRVIGSGRTHPGLVRAENQDRFEHFNSPFGEVFITADGMGGAKGGGTAAQMVVDGFRNQLLSLPNSLSYSEALRATATAVTTHVHSMGNSGDPQIAGMGSTVVLALISDSRLIVANVGDSRAYLYRAGQLKRLTRDHTLVQQMVDSGMISAEDARWHPNASVLSRAIGQAPDVEMEVSAPIELQPGDGVLLCSDGLCGYVDDLAIEDTLKHFEAAPEEAVSALIQLALQAGGEDNVTVQFVHMARARAVQESRETVADTSRPAGARRGFLRKKGLLAVTILVAVLVIGLVWRVRAHMSNNSAKPVQNGERTTGGLNKTK